MTLFRNLLIGVGFMLAAVYVAANLMDPKWQVLAEVNINTQSTSRLDEKLINAKAWEEWMYVNPSNFKGMVFTYLDRVEGVGATQRWRQGDSEGLRSLDRFDDNGVVFQVRHGTLRYAEEIRITQTDTGYNLKMRVHGELGPVNRLVFWLFHQTRMEHNYTQSLQHLKKVVEKK